MIPSTVRLFARPALALVVLLGTAMAQDVSYPGYGNTTIGTAFDERAPTDLHVRTVHVQSGSQIDGIRLFYGARDGSPQGSSPLMGGSTGGLSNFVIPDDQYLQRIEVWYTQAIGYISGITLQTNRGYNQTYGTQTGTMHAFQAVGDHEIVGLHGTYGTPGLYSVLLMSLGVTTRPTLATCRNIGSGCSSSAGPMHMQFRPGRENLILGTAPIAEVTNVPVNMQAIISVGVSTTHASGIPLPFSLALIGAPGCSVYASLDSLTITSREPNGTAGIIVVIPSNPAIVGVAVSFQGFTLQAPNPANLAASDGLTCMIGGI